MNDGEGDVRFVKSYTGHIPHLTSRLFYVNRWERRLKGGKLENSYRGDYGKIYYKLNDPRKGSPFNEDRIIGFPADDVVLNQVRENIKIRPYIATCRPTNDTDSKDRLFFVMSFTESGWNHLDSIYIFKTIKDKQLCKELRNEKTPKDKKGLLFYLSAVRVICLTDDGHISLYLDEELSAKHKDTSELDQYLKESYQVVRDFLHEHTHHPNPKHYPEDEVADSIIVPVNHKVVVKSGKFQKPVIDEKVIQRIITIYQLSLVSHVEQTTALFKRLDEKKDIFRPAKKYLRIVTLLKQADGICTYFNKYVRDLENKVAENNETRTNNTSETERECVEYNLSQAQLLNDRHQIEDMSDVFQTLYTEVESRLQVIVASRAEMILVLSLIITGLVLFFTLPETIKTLIPYYIPLGIALIGFIGYYSLFCLRG